jgi:nucleoside-diphosphate-sugar epimerase
VYGVQEEIVDENCELSCLRPQSPYAESKLYGEKLLQEMRGRLNFVILRLGTIFGYSVGMRFHTAVNKFIWQAINGEPISVWSTALNQRRPYCGLKDCISAINLIVKENMFDGELYNILTLNLTVHDILETIKRFIPDIRVGFVDSPIMNQLSYNVSNRKSLEKGFTYNDNLEESIKETISRLSRVNYTISKDGVMVAG